MEVTDAPNDSAFVLQVLENELDKAMDVLNAKKKLVESV